MYPWKYYTIKDALKPSSEPFPDPIEVGDVATTHDWIYDGLAANISNVEVHLCMPDTKRAKVGASPIVASI